MFHNCDINELNDDFISTILKWLKNNKIKYDIDDDCSLYNVDEAICLIINEEEYTLLQYILNDNDDNHYNNLIFDIKLYTYDYSNNKNIIINGYNKIIEYFKNKFL
jgi:hypothetical protein